MALPIIFAALTNPTMVQLDQNFAALGLITPIPCTVSGLNVITMTPQLGTPTVSAYANYSQFVGVAAGTNTGGVTALAPGLAALNVYKDTLAGPALLTGNEIILGTSFTLIYDSALNVGSGGFHLRGGAGALTGTNVSLATLTATRINSTNENPSTLTVGVSSSLATAQASSILIGSGSAITRNLSTTASLSFSALPPQNGQTQLFTLPGASINDVVGVGIPTGNSLGLVFGGYVSSDGVVTMTAVNASGSTLTPVPGTYRVRAEGYT